MSMAKNKLVCKQSEHIPLEHRYETFFSNVRQEGSLFPDFSRYSSVKEIFHEMREMLLNIGGNGIPEGVGSLMHIYMLCSIATMPLSDPEQISNRELWLKRISQERLLIANTGSERVNRSNNTENTVTQAMAVDGGYVVNGEKNFVSLAEVADILIFNANVKGSEGFAFFIVPFDRSSILIKESCFDESLGLRTYSIEFKELFVDQNMVMKTDSQSTSLAFLYQRSWFLSLVSSVYLGAARKALDEAISFAQNTFLSDKKLLADLDGVQAEIGRYEMQWEAAMAPSYICGEKLTDFLNNPSMKTIERLYHSSIVAKKIGCDTAEDIVKSVRRFIGTQSMTANSKVNEISKLISLGPLHPVVSAQSERLFGSKVLGNVSR
jgi:alkylation response protein AidB-like acyl-CoA dehydrogenase